MRLLAVAAAVAVGWRVVERELLLLIHELVLGSLIKRWTSAFGHDADVNLFCFSRWLVAPLEVSDLERVHEATLKIVLLELFGSHALDDHVLVAAFLAAPAVLEHAVDQAADVLGRKQGAGTIGVRGFFVRFVLREGRDDQWNGRHSVRGSEFGVFLVNLYVASWELFLFKILVRVGAL